MELSGGMDTFYFLFLVVIYTGVYNCGNSSSCPLKMCEFYCMLIISLKTIANQKSEMQF